MTSQLFWSASLTKVILSPSALTVPLSVFSGAAAALSLPISQLLPISCATAAMLNVTQIAITKTHSFFIERNLLLGKVAPVELNSLVQYESSCELDVRRPEMLRNSENLFFEGHYEFGRPK